MCLSNIAYMNIRQTLAQLANEMDSMGMYDEANSLDNVLKNLPKNVGEHVTAEDVMQMPNSEEIVRNARYWVEDCNWEDKDNIKNYSDYTILKGVDNHYSGGLSQFLKDNQL